MKKIIKPIVFVCLLSLSNFVIANDVVGEDQNGNAVQGAIETNHGGNISGEISDQNGNTQHFEGQRENNGTVNGVTENGDVVHMNSN